MKGLTASARGKTGQTSLGPGAAASANQGDYAHIAKELAASGRIGQRLDIGRAEKNVGEVISAMQPAMLELAR